MKKREITNNDLEQLFNNIIEQSPLISEEQVILLQSKLPKSNLGSTLKRFSQFHFKTFLLSATVVLIIAAAIIWMNPARQSKEENIENTPQKNRIQFVTVDTLAVDSINREISKNKANEDPVSKKSTLKTRTTQVKKETTILLSDVYKHFDKKPQVFSFQANRDTTIICKEGTRIKINANSFMSEKSGNRITGAVQISVKEHYKMSDIVLSNLTTTSNDRILETGGMLHITALADNENCIIKSGSDIEIGFPYLNNKDNMELFYGKWKNDKIDWTPANAASILDDVEIQEKIEKVYVIVEEMPEFPGGDKALRKYLEQNIQYPYSEIKNKTEEKVRVSFVVDTSGYTKDIRIIRGSNKTLGKAAAYVVSNMPKWKPGKQRGKPVNVTYTIPIYYSINNDELTDEEIKQSKILEEELKEFKYDFESNRNFRNSKIFNELEKKIKSDSLQDSDISEVNEYIFSVTQLGWINCDRFYNNDKPLINFFIQGDKSNNIIVNAIFHRFKSLMPGENKSGRITFNNVPLGEKITIVAIKVVNNKIFLSVKETVVTKNGEIKLDFKQVTMKFLSKEMEKLNKYY
jgi:TonB family protein